MLNDFSHRLAHSHIYLIIYLIKRSQVFLNLNFTLINLPNKRLSYIRFPILYYFHKTRTKMYKEKVRCYKY